MIVYAEHNILCRIKTEHNDYKLLHNEGTTPVYEHFILPMVVVIL